MCRAVMPPSSGEARCPRCGEAVVPVLLILGVTEGALRLAGFGYQTSFFIPADDGFVESNERFAWRFMPPALAR